MFRLSEIKACSLLLLIVLAACSTERTVRNEVRVSVALQFSGNELVKASWVQGMD